MRRKLACSMSYSMRLLEDLGQILSAANYSITVWNGVGSLPYRLESEASTACTISWLGTSDAEKEHLGLHSRDVLVPGFDASATNSKRWRYLGHPTQLKAVSTTQKGFKSSNSLRKLEFPRNDIADICQVLAAVLHLGQLEFETTQSTSSAANDSGTFSHDGGEAMTVDSNAAQGTSHYHARSQGARENADDLARALYSLLVAYVVESMNQRICAPEELVRNTVAIVDFPGFQHLASTGCVLDQILTNAANEALYQFSIQSFFEQKAQVLAAEEISIPATSYFDNTDAVKALLRPSTGLLSILDDQMKKGRTDGQFLDTIKKRF
ncbi:hypothetical protein MRB53_040973 [Persea americana]|nr:hypothetical protein MRB53_040973 [Persea americana]